MGVGGCSVSVTATVLLALAPFLAAPCGLVRTSTVFSRSCQAYLFAFRLGLGACLAFAGRRVGRGRSAAGSWTVRLCAARGGWRGRGRRHVGVLLPRRSHGLLRSRLTTGSRLAGHHLAWRGLSAGWEGAVRYDPAAILSHHLHVRGRDLCCGVRRRRPYDMVSMHVRWCWTGVHHACDV